MRIGRLYVLSVPYVAGFACLGGPYIAGFRLTGWVFLVMLAAAPLVYLFDRTSGRFPLWLWMPWILVVILSLTWVDEVGLGNIQDVCQIVTPFVIAPIASKSLKSSADLDALLRAFFHCTLILVACLALHILADVFILYRPMAMTAALTGCVFVARIADQRRLAIAGWSGCLLVAAATGSRMATVVLLLEWLLLPSFRRKIQRLVVAILVLILTFALFYTPRFQERFFGEDGGTVRDVTRGRFSSAGRFEAWEQLWKEVARRPMLGAGAGSSEPLVSRVWPESSHPHNDYLRILLEQGATGLIFFLFGAGSQILHLRFPRPQVEGRRATVRTAAYVGMLAFLMLSFTDNPIIYGVWFSHPLFVLLGASYPPWVSATRAQSAPESVQAGRAPLRQTRHHQPTSFQRSSDQTGTPNSASAMSTWSPAPVVQMPVSA